MFCKNWRLRASGSNLCEDHMDYNCDVNFGVLGPGRNNLQSVVTKHCFKYNYQFVVRGRTDFEAASKERENSIDS